MGGGYWGSGELVSHCFMQLGITLHFLTSLKETHHSSLRFGNDSRITSHLFLLNVRDLFHKMECIPDQEAEIGEALGSKGKPSTVLLLNEHSNKMTPGDILLSS